MAEFDFDIRALFAKPIIKIRSNLRPQDGWQGQLLNHEIEAKISKIINFMGLQSAKAQNIKSAFTTAQKVRDAGDHIVYLMADLGSDGGGSVQNGSVIGLLKIGKKNLFLYNEGGEVQNIVGVNCILDFYIHESRQRSGHGKTLFDAMLKDTQLQALHFTIDRPSDKMLRFLRKHYNLDRTVPQTNNFVVYEGFFDQFGPSLKNPNENVFASSGRSLQIQTKRSVVSVSGGRYGHRPTSHTMFDYCG